MAKTKWHISIRKADGHEEDWTCLSVKAWTAVMDIMSRVHPKDHNWVGSTIKITGASHDPNRGTTKQ